MKIAVVGTGYVGLVTGACFSEMGHTVTCVDNDQGKIDLLNAGSIPIWEPGLDEMVARNKREGRILFTTDLALAVEENDVLFIAVGTPPYDDGSADLSHVLDVAKGIARYMNSYKVVVDKSTVPVGTADLVRKTIRAVLEKRGVKRDFDVISNPEFLKEGSAINDFMKPDRIVVGSATEKSARIMQQLYAPFNFSSDRLITMSIKSAEMTKYAANAMLATKISFINEIALLCEKLGADVSEVRQGIGSDNRIGYKFIYPGVGYGGSCFPKDIKALLTMAKEVGINPLILTAVEQRNIFQKKLLAQKVIGHFGENLTDRCFAIWGLAFKPQTDDMREAPSIVVASQLLDAGASLSVYDPVAIEQAKKTMPESQRISYFTDQYEALEKADALLLVTEWHQFRNPDFDLVKRLMKTPVIFDGRNQWDPALLKGKGFTVYSIGRK